MIQESKLVEAAWSVEAFRRFWAKPDRDTSIVPAILTDDVAGYWPGNDTPTRGREAYMRCIDALVAALPDMYLTVAMHAASADVTFVRWVMHATGAKGSFELTGIDQIRTREGRLCENIVVFDTAAFEARSGKRIPWAGAQ